MLNKVMVYTQFYQRTGGTDDPYVSHSFFSKLVEDIETHLSSPGMRDFVMIKAPTTSFGKNNWGGCP